MVYADKRSFCIFKKFYNTVGKKELFSLKNLFLVIISTTRECPSTPRTPETLRQAEQSQHASDSDSDKSVMFSCFRLKFI